MLEELAAPSSLVLVKPSQARSGAEIIPGTTQNVDRIVQRLLSNQIVVMPYGRKERRVFAMLGLANDDVVARMKDIKKRGGSQAVAISGIPDVAPYVAELDETESLVKAAVRLKVYPEDVVNRCFEVGAVGLILNALEGLPEGATQVNDRGIRTVLIAGEATKEPYDIFPTVYRKVMERGQVLVGSSANVHGDDTYHALMQDEAIERLRDLVDVFVQDPTHIGLRPFFKHLTSATMIDLTGKHPHVVRWGNVHPDHFKGLFPDLEFEPSELKKYQGRERKYHVVLKSIVPRLKHLGK